MSTTANIGLSQSDYITINQVETSSSGHGSGAESSSLTSRDLPLSGGGMVTNERSPSSQEESTSQVKGDEGRPHGESGDNKTGSAVERANPTPPQGHVTAESASVKDISRGEGLAAAPTKEAAAMATGSSELQLPAKQSLAVLSNVRKR